MTDIFPMDVFCPPKFKRRWMRITALVLYPIWFMGASVVFVIGGVAFVLLLLAMIVFMSVQSVMAYVTGGERPE